MGWSCQIIRAGQRGALCGNASPASTDFRKPKLPAPAFCFECSVFFNLGYNILDDLNPQGFLDQPVESTELVALLRQWHRRFFPLPVCCSSAVAAADQGLAPQLVSAGPGFNEMPSN